MITTLISACGLIIGAGICAGLLAVIALLLNAAYHEAAGIRIDAVTARQEMTP